MRRQINVRYYAHRITGDIVVFITTVRNLAVVRDVVSREKFDISLGEFHRSYTRLKG